MYLLATALALLLGVAVTAVLISLMFWTVSSEGARYILPAIVWFGGGLVIPLPLLPDGLAAVLGYLPFAGLMDIPFRIYVGHLAGAEALARLALQVGWLVLLVLLGRLLLARGLRRVVILGG